jgi:murein DD-endopeptidase MepM/ murein hydrolase activator NlpD
MKISFNKDYCLWVVPPNEGKVRKYRFTLRKILAALLLGVMFGGGLVYVMGDYARLQIVRLDNYFTLRKLTSERNQLLSTAKGLKAQVKDLEAVKGKASSYQEDVRERLEQIASLVESATALGVFEKSGKSKSSTKDKEGIGGAEVECVKGECKGLLELDAGGPEESYLRLSGEEYNPDAELILMLDKLTEALRVIPFGLPAKGSVSSPFGVRFSPFERSLRMHEGIDFSMPVGSKIYSSAFGVVSRAERHGTYGLVVDVRHNSRVTTRYAHMSKALVKVGDRVSRGHVLGLAGSSGRSTGPHLHFEVLVDGKQRNPARFLELAKTLQSVL